MRWLRSMALMFAVNMLFVLALSAILILFHVQLHLIGFALLFGFGGAFFSLMISKWLVKRHFKMVQVHAGDADVKGILYRIAGETAQRASLPMPQIWLYADERPNAFAVGATRRGAMVAVSTGLLNLLENQDQLRAVLGHEMGHISNGDMLSTTLLMGLMNSYVIWLGNLVGRYFGSNIITDLVVTLVAEIGLSFLAMIPISAFSRHREFAADAFSAKVWGPQPMIAALQRLESCPVVCNPRKEALATSYIHGNWKGLFATHPSTQRRIARLSRQT
ncbi:M48 family metalloprotease [Acidithiobacillus ferrivorans]|nr:M48 family metalloprotease [Acidithiobacillus ferrivorans]